MIKQCLKHPESKRYNRRCLECGRENAREWNRKNREHCRQKNHLYHKINKLKIKERKRRNYLQTKKEYLFSARNRMLKNTYNMTIDEYNLLLKKQKGLCAICKKQETVVSNKTNGTIDSLRVDHCHSTNINRGLLCSKCNLAIGLFKENLITIKNSIQYLKKWNKIRL
jgi:hypothetical protein